MIVPAHLAEWGWLGAFGIGVLASFHPCPLTTNIAALALICARGDRPASNLIRGASLAAGLCFTYVALAVLIGRTVLASGFVAAASAVASAFMGPLFLLAGMLLTGLFAVSSKRPALTRLMTWLSSRQAGWAELFGVGCLLALAFCPATAGLFFAVLLPMAIASGAPSAHTLAFGLGFGLPVVLASVVVRAGVNQLDVAKRWSARITPVAGWVLIAVGVAVAIRSM